MIDTSEDVTARPAKRDDRILCGKADCIGCLGRYRAGVLHLAEGMTEMLVDGQRTAPRSFRIGKWAEGQHKAARSGLRTRAEKRLRGNQDYVVPSWVEGAVGADDVVRVHCPNGKCGTWSRIDQAALYRRGMPQQR